MRHTSPSSHSPSDAVPCVAEAGLDGRLRVPAFLGRASEGHPHNSPRVLVVLFCRPLIPA